MTTPAIQRESQAFLDGMEWEVPLTTMARAMAMVRMSLDALRERQERRPFPEKFDLATCPWYAKP